MNADLKEVRRLEELRDTSYFPSGTNHPTSPHDVVFKGKCVNPDNAPRWAETRDELLRIRLLEVDWDGEGAPAPEVSVVDGAIRFAIDMDGLNFPPPQRTHLGVNGTIYFEWHSPEGYRELEVYGPCRAESRFVRKGSDAAEVFEILLQSQPA